MNISYSYLEQRKFDGKWVLWGVASDPNLTEDDKAYIERREKLGIPEIKRWFPIKIYDWNIEVMWTKGEI